MMMLRWLYPLFGFTPVSQLLYEDLPWARWPWQRCLARTECWERCDLHKRHKGDHALGHGMDIPRWSTVWTDDIASRHTRILALLRISEDQHGGVPTPLTEAIRKILEEE